MARRRTAQWQLFEQEVSELVRAFGYNAKATKPSHDFGVDVVAEHETRKLVIQCKLYGKGRIGGETIMQLVGSRSFFKADVAMCISTSRFTKQAYEIAEKEGVHLIDRDALITLCQQRGLTIPALTVIYGQRYLVRTDEAPVTFGRADDNRIVIRHDLASRHHAAAIRSGLSLMLEDLRSTNGTRHNGQKITSPVPLSYGDSIQIAGSVFTVLMRGPAGELYGGAEAGS